MITLFNIQAFRISYLKKIALVYWFDFSRFHKPMVSGMLFIGWKQIQVLKSIVYDIFVNMMNTFLCLKFSSEEIRDKFSMLSNFVRAFSAKSRNHIIAICILASKLSSYACITPSTIARNRTKLLLSISNVTRSNHKLFPATFTSPYYRLSSRLAHLCFCFLRKLKTFMSKTTAFSRAIESFIHSKLTRLSKHFCTTIIAINFNRHQLHYSLLKLNGQLIPPTYG